MTKTLFLAPYFLQTLVMLFDEFYFHRKRGLPRWEAYGHPLDTFSVLLCYGFILGCPASSPSRWFYLVLVILSCIHITKDEWLHLKLCSGTEQWLHSLLFILHPITLGLAGWGWLHSHLFHDSYFIFIIFQFLMTFCFMAYQFLYWRTRWTRRMEPPRRSTTRSTIN